MRSSTRVRRVPAERSQSTKTSICTGSLCRRDLNLRHPDTRVWSNHAVGEEVAVIRAFDPDFVRHTENFACIDRKNKIWFAETVDCQWFALRIRLMGALSSSSLILRWFISSLYFRRVCTLDINSGRRSLSCVVTY
ncbi:TPA: hypothetical protein N0F65_012761 [Lagenidium giganteum]|uniref:Uncharacterized protein n=1 Tax=Lagenidium giganteum TaxID=4803 RepID=A0AAV2YEH7_9STRA|nr:TPA: hypothetical protein N0F65_012761 [Lagenidium giganteum]